MGKKRKKKKSTQPAPEPATPPPPEAAHASIPPGSWKVALALAVAAIVLYAGMLTHAYTLDDLHVVQQNPVVNEGRLLDALTTSYWPPELGAGASNWRPLATVSWTLERQVGGPPRLQRDGSVVGGALPIHHGLNALLHGLSVLALFPLAWRLLRDHRAAWLACALFAVHPAHTEVVGPVVGRTDLLAALATFLTLEWWCRHRETGLPQWLVAATAAFAVGLGGKESAAPVLLVLPLADRWLCGRPWRDLRSRAALAYVPLLAVALVYAVARMAVLGTQALSHSQAVELGVLGRLGFAGRNTVLSTLLLSFPVRFHHVITTVPLDAEFTFPLPGTGMGVVWLLAALPIWLGWIPLVRRAPRAAFCWVAALAHWAPTSGLVPAAAGMALRFLFIPTGFVACAAVLGGAALLRARPAWRWGLLGTAAVWGGIAVGLTLWRVPAWANNAAFYRAVLAEVPEAYTANYGLGAWIATHGRDMPAARRHFERAIQTAGDSKRGINARMNLAKSYEYAPGQNVEWGPGSEPARALALYEDALRISPDWATAHLAAGRVAEHLGRRTEALRHFQRVLELQPVNQQAAELHGKCGEILRGLGRGDEARTYFVRASELREDRAADWLRRGFPDRSAEDLWYGANMAKAAAALQPPGPARDVVQAAIARLTALAVVRARDAATGLTADPAGGGGRARAVQLLERALALGPSPADAAALKAQIHQLRAGR